MQLRVLWDAALSFCATKSEKQIDRLTDCGTQHWLQTQSHSEHCQASKQASKIKRRAKTSGERQCDFDVTGKIAGDSCRGS